jgi:hypothetical protein
MVIDKFERMTMFSDVSNTTKDCRVKMPLSIVGLKRPNCDTFEFALALHPFGDSIRNASRAAAFLAKQGLITIRFLESLDATLIEPNHGKWLLELANTQNADAWRVQLNPTPSGPLQQDYVHSKQEPLPKLAPGLVRSYPSALLLLRSRPP